MNPRDTTELIIMTAATTSLMDFLRALLTDSELREDFANDPQGTLDEHGLGNLSPEDIHDALVLSEDNQDGDFSRDYNTGHNAINVVTPPPPPHHDYATAAESHEAAVQYLNNYITNNYIDDRDTITDNSVNQQIDTGGGDFDQDIDIDSTVASGDGAVAAGDDIKDSTITTGDDNQVGDGNVRGDGNVVGDNNEAVTGDHNTTSFGEGDATTTTIGGNVTVGEGGAFGSGGDVTVDNSDNSQHNVGNDNSDHSINDSFKDQSDNSVHDSGNSTTDNSVHDSGNETHETTVEDSFNHGHEAPVEVIH
jgi:hypothetical protein